MRILTRLALALSVLAFASFAQDAALRAAAGKDLFLDGALVGRSVAPQPGEICAVCSKPVGADDFAYEVEGARIAAHAVECDARLRANVRQFLAELRPRGAFLGAEPAEGAARTRLSLGWFWAGAYVLLGLVFAALCAHRALRAGHNPIPWFAAGFLLNAFAFLALLTRPTRETLAPAGLPKGLGKIATTRAPLPCPACGAMNHPAAAACSACGAKLTPQVRSEVNGAGLRIH